MYETMEQMLYQENIRCTFCGKIAKCYIRDDVRGEDFPFCESCWHDAVEIHEMDEDGNIVMTIDMEE